MSNQNNELAMRAAGKAYLTAGTSVVAILRAFASNPDEAYINTLKFEFYLGGMLTVEPDDAKARAYLPDDNIKVANDRCAFSPFDPDKTSKKPQRPEHIQRVYNQMKANWSNWREAAGLPSLKVTRAAQAPSGDKDAVDGAPKVTPKGLGVETGLSKKIVIEYIRGVEDWLTRTFNANRDQVDNGHVGDVLRKLLPDMNAYLVDLTEALQRDTDTPTKAKAKREADLKASNAALHAELAALKAQMTAPADIEIAKAA